MGASIPIKSSQLSSPQGPLRNLPTPRNTKVEGLAYLAKSPSAKARLKSSIRVLRLSQSNDKVMCSDAMMRATFAVAVALLCRTATAEQPPVAFLSPCECHDNHGEHRW